MAAEATVKIGSSLKLNNLGKFRLPKHFVGELKINSDTDAIIKMYKNSNQWGKNNFSRVNLTKFAFLRFLIFANKLCLVENIQRKL